MSCIWVLFYSVLLLRRCVWCKLTLVDFVMYPVTGNSEVDEKSKRMAESYDIPIVLSLPTNVTATPGTKVLQSCFAVMASKGIPGLLAESGQFGIYDQKKSAVHLKGLKNLLHVVGILDEEPTMTNKQHHIKYRSSMRSPLNGLWYPAKSVGEIVKEGEYIGKITDYFGETIFEVIAPADAQIVAMRNSLYINMGHAMYYLAEVWDK